jgi:CelD/BcsL family acetyltransferase involved in cellulose biosynthesis
MQTRLLALAGLSGADEQAWRALAEKAVEPNPYFEPDFLLLAARHFEGFAKTRILVAQDGNEFRALVPISGVERPRIPPRRVITTRGNPTAISCLSTPLVDRACVDEAIDALLMGLGEGATGDGLPGIIAFKRIGDDGPVARSMLRATGGRGLPVFVKDTWERGTVSRAGQWDSSLGESRRREIARLRRVLARRSENEVTVVDRTTDPDAVEDFLEMEASGWKGSGHGSAFARDPATVAWFREWRDRWVASGRLFVWALNVGDVSIAMQWFVRSGDGLFFFRMAYDPAYSQYSPGRMLLSSALEDLRQQTDAQWVDSCADRDNRFILGMLPEPRTLSMILIGTGGRLDRSLVSALPAMTALVEARGKAQDRWARRRTTTSAAVAQKKES